MSFSLFNPENRALDEEPVLTDVRAHTQGSRGIICVGLSNGGRPASIKSVPLVSTSFWFLGFDFLDLCFALECFAFCLDFDHTDVKLLLATNANLRFHSAGPYLNRLPIRGNVRRVPTTGRHSWSEGSQ